MKLLSSLIKPGDTLQLNIIDYSIAGRYVVTSVDDNTINVILSSGVNKIVVSENENSILMLFGKANMASYWYAVTLKETESVFLNDKDEETKYHAAILLNDSKLITYKDLTCTSA